MIRKALFNCSCTVVVRIVFQWSLSNSFPCSADRMTK